jgi:YfiH family protein
MNPAGVITPDWPAPPSVRAAITTRELRGNSPPPYDACNLGLRCGENPAIVHANRELLERALALPEQPRWLRQVHGDRSLRVTHEVFAEEQEADAAFTTQRSVVLAILTADCLPILLCAHDGSEVAAIHAGWRGLAAGVIESCVRRLATPREHLLAWLGPAIGPQSYEVGKDVHDAFGADPGAFTPGRTGHWQCDLFTLARRRLNDAGILRVHGGDFDTFTDPRFYSHRRDRERSGRFASLIWRADV